MKTFIEIQSRRGVPLIFVVFALAFVTFGCKKSRREIAEENAIKRHQQEAGHPQMANPALRAALSNYMRTSEGMEIDSALNFMTSLKKEDRLPGIPKSVKGMLRLEKKPTDTTPEGGCSQEIHYFTMNVPHQDYFYFIARISSNSPWELKRAVQTDVTGKVIAEYPVQ
jgi:hypothetical protein